MTEIIENFNNNNFIIMRTDKISQTFYVKMLLKLLKESSRIYVKKKNAKTRIGCFRCHDLRVNRVDKDFESSIFTLYS